MIDMPISLVTDTLFFHYDLIMKEPPIDISITDSFGEKVPDAEISVREINGHFMTSGQFLLLLRGKVHPFDLVRSLDLFGFKRHKFIGLGIYAQVITFPDSFFVGQFNGLSQVLVI